MDIFPRDIRQIIRNYDYAVNFINLRKINKHIRCQGYTKYSRILLKTFKEVTDKNAQHMNDEIEYIKRLYFEFFDYEKRNIYGTQSLNLKIVSQVIELMHVALCKQFEITYNGPLPDNIGDIGTAKKYFQKHLS